MGKIKSKMIKNSAKNLIKKNINFTENFEENKRILAGTMPSKKLKNQMAGFLARIKKQEKENRPKILSKE
jgi:ribosomal protein S17E